MLNVCALQRAAAQVLAEATATPVGSTQGGSTARNTLQLNVGDCPAVAQSMNTVSVIAQRPVGHSIPSIRWSADTQAAWMTSLKYTDNATIAFNVTLAKLESTSSRLAGTVTVVNPTSAPVNIKSVTVSPDFSSGTGPAAAAAGAPNVLEAECKQTTVLPGSAVNCSYVGTVSGGGPGSLVVDVALSTGSTISSQPILFELPAQTSKAGSRTQQRNLLAPGASGCADIATGLFLSPALMAPNRTAPNYVQQIKACEGGTEQVSVLVGPWGAEACGSYTVRRAANALYHAALCCTGLYHTLLCCVMLCYVCSA